MSLPATARVCQSANGRQLRVGNRQMNKRTDEQTNRWIALLHKALALWRGLKTVITPFVIYWASSDTCYKLKIAVMNIDEWWSHLIHHIYLIITPHRMLPVVSDFDLLAVTISSYHDIVAPRSAVWRSPSPVRWPGMHYLTTSETRRSVNFRKTLKTHLFRNALGHLARDSCVA